MLAGLVKVQYSGDAACAGAAKAARAMGRAYNAESEKIRVMALFFPKVQDHPWVRGRFRACVLHHADIGRGVIVVQCTKLEMTLANSGRNGR